MIKSLNDYTVTTSIPIAWGEMDAFAHVNNVIFFRYFETARIKHIEYLGLEKSAITNNIGPILGAISCKFIRPLYYPDTVHVGVRVIKVEESKLFQEYCMVSEKQNAVVAVGEGTLVAYNYKLKKKATFPASILEKAGHL